MALAALFWSSSRYVDGQLKADMEAEFSALTHLFDNGDSEQLLKAVSKRTETALDKDRFYLLATEDGRVLSGNLTKWPGEASVSFSGEVHNILLDENILPGQITGIIKSPGPFGRCRAFEFCTYDKLVAGQDICRPLSS